MAELTDALKSRARLKRFKGKVPDWWPLAQIIGAVALFGLLAFYLIAGNNGSSSQEQAVTSLAPTLPAQTQSQPSTTAGSNSTASTRPSTSGTTASSVPSSTATGSDSYPTPTVLGDGKVRIATASGGFRSIEVGAWNAASNQALALVPGGTVKTGQLVLEALPTYDFAVVVTTAQGDRTVQVTTKRAASGQWVAS